MIKLIFADKRLLLLNIAVLLLLGVVSFNTLPRMEDPVLVERAALVSTVVPGANAKRIESTVTEPLSDGLREFDEVKEIRTFSRSNVSTIIVNLKDDIVDVDEVWARIRDRISDIRVKLPTDALAPELEIIRVRSFASIVALKWKSEHPPVYSVLRRYANELAMEIRNVANTEEVESYGMPEEEITVSVDQAELSKLSLNIEEIAGQVLGSDSKQPAGLFRSSNKQLTLEIGSELDSLDRIRRIPVRSTQGGLTCYLEDIAKVEKGIRNPAGSEAIVDDCPAIMIASSLSPTARIDYWDDDLREVLESFKSRLPPQVELVKIFAQRKYVDDRIYYLVRDLILSALAVFVVVLAMMGWRSACIVGMALPLASCVVFATFRMLGIPLHQMSLSGLVIALGMLEGTAIIIIDEIQRRLRNGESNADAIRNGLKHMALPLLGSTGTTILSFLPIAIMPGPSGEFVGTIGLSVILALVASLVLSFTVLPALTSIYFGPNIGRTSFWSNGFSSRMMSVFYEKSLRYSFNHPWMTTVLGIALAVPGFILVLFMPVQFFPSADRDQLHIELELSSQANLRETREVALQITKLLEEEQEIARVDWVLGRSAPSFYYNMIGTRQNAPNFGEALIQTRNIVDFSGFAKRIQDKLNLRVSKGQARVLPLEQGPPYSAPIELRLLGNDDLQLRQFGEKLRGMIQGVAGVTQTEADLTDSIPKISYKINEAESSLVNVPSAEMARQLQLSLEGAIGGTVFEANESIPVRIRLKDSDRQNLREIERVSLRSAQGALGNAGSLSLSALGQATLKSEPANLCQLNGVRVNEIRGFIAPDVLPSTVLAEIKRQLATDEYKLPSGCSIEFAGESQKRTEAVGQLISNGAILVAGTIVVLVFSLRSFRAMLIIVSVGGLSFGMALWSLDITGFPLGFTAVVGTMGMIGIAINDSIVVLAELKGDESCRLGNMDAMIRLVLQSTRHVLCTTFTVGCSFIPMLIEGGTFWPPMAMVVIGGVFGATLLALYWIPAVFILTLTAEKSPTQSSVSTPAKGELQGKAVVPNAVEESELVAVDFSI